MSATANTATDAAKEIRRLKAALQKERARCAKLDEQVQLLTTRDELTGLFNRSYIDETLSSMYYDSRRYQKSFCIVLAGVDRFRKIKQDFGAAEAELVLEALGEFLRASLRQTDWAGRLGGEEFVVILPFTTLDDAARMAERLRKFIAKHEWENGNKVTLSLGVARSTEAESRDELLSVVRERFNAAAKQGRNRVVYKTI